MKNKVTKEDLVGDIKYFPIEIVQKMCEYQAEHGNKFDPIIFQEDCCSSAYLEGFEWDDTLEGSKFWFEVICYRRFELFFEKYPKQIKDNKMNELKIDIPKGYEFDCIGDGVIKFKEVKKELPKTWEECKT